MANRTQPGWFRVVAVLLILWGLIGFIGFVMDRMTTPAQLAAMPAYDRQLYLWRPAWTIWAYGIATATGLIGSIALLLGRRIALPVLIVSLVAVVALFGFMLGATDLIAAKGFAGAAGLPIAIAAIGAFEVWLARHAATRGWIG